MALDYCHTHLHTVNSRLDGMVGIPDLMDYCKANGMTSVCMTDHGNMSGAISFYTEARERGINPIIGQEIYLVDDHSARDGARYHEGILAMSWTGYQNLVRLSTLGFTEGLRRNYFACIDDAQIEEFNQDLICLSGCISGRLARLVMGGIAQKEALLDKADHAELCAQDEGAFNQARIAAKNLAMSAAPMSNGAKRERIVAESKEAHNFLDLITDLVAQEKLEAYVADLHVQAHAAWNTAWEAAKAQIERRLTIFGDRYYLETQIIPSESQLRYNEYVRQLSELYGIPIVVTADAHYLTRDDADLHRMMLKVRTDKRPSKSKDKKAPVVVEFPDDQASAILSSDGSDQELAVLFDDLTLEQGACTGRKIRIDTKIHADKRRRWVLQAQIYYLQNQGETDEAQELSDSIEDDVSISDIDPGRSYADWEAEFWVRTPQEMLDAGAVPIEMENTLSLAARCNLEIPMDTIHMPDFPVPALEDEFGFPMNLDHNDYLILQCQKGLREYLSDNPGLDEARYAQRLAYELKVICEAGFANYFLIVWDYINYVREIGGLTGPGRGSAAASLVTFVLGITKRIDPLQYRDLMFERFLTPGRPDLPDIDTDFDFGSAERVFEYCKAKYGADRVCKIGTFSHIGVRQALKDMGRVLGIPFIDVDKAANILKDFKPEDDQVEEDNKALFDLNNVAGLIPELEVLQKKSSLHAQWFDYANRLTGNRRNASQHASGVAIASTDLITLGVPLMASIPTGGKVPVITTQFDMDDMATLGIPKFDQLKLSSLNTIAECERLIGEEFSIEEISLTDPKTFRALSKGDNLAIFQVSQSKVRGVLRAVQPTSLSDIAAVITIIRPGLFAKDKLTGMTQEELFKARRQGSVPVTYAYPFLAEILKDSQGIMIYQEQILKVCWACGMAPLEADKLRKVLSKKKMSEAKKFQDSFIAGAIKHQGLTQDQGQELWDLIVEFAAYGFNAAHAYAYGLISYWTSYLKTHYPAQFMAATLTVQSSKTSKAAKLLIPKLLEDCNQMGRNMPVLPPNVNHSEASFSVEFTSTPEGLAPAIRYGLGGIKNLGIAAEKILEERTNGPYTSLEDLDKRLTACMERRPSKTVLESLAYSGALDDFFSHRSEALHEIAISRESTKFRREILVNAGWTADRKARLDQIQAELCGNFYFVRDNQDVLGRDVDNFFEATRGQRLTIGGRVIEVKLDKKSRTGSLFHRVLLKTQWGDVTVDFFPGRVADPPAHLQKLKEKLFGGAVIMVTGAVRDDRSLWGSSIQLPKAEYRGEAKEDKATLTKEAEQTLLGESA